MKTRQDLGSNGVEDMVTISDLNEASILWNLRIRYDNQNIYTYIGKSKYAIEVIAIQLNVILMMNVFCCCVMENATLIDANRWH